MSHRIQSRQSSGRWQRNTMANTFGLSVEICPHCRAINSHAAHEPKPTVCHDCGKSLKPNPSPEQPQ